MKTSEHVDKIFEALALAQGEIEAATKGADNPFFKSKYADLAAIWAVCRDPLSKNGLAVIQSPEINPDMTRVMLVTIIGHSSGQWIESELSATPKKADVQGVGALIKYLRRYALEALVGVETVDDPEDDDGEVDRAAAANGKGKKMGKAAEPVWPSGPSQKAKPDRPYDPETLRKGLQQRAAKGPNYPDDREAEQRSAIRRWSKFAGLTEEDRHAASEFLFGVSSTKDYTIGMGMALSGWVKQYQNEDGEWVPDQMAVTELSMVLDYLGETKAVQAAMMEDDPAVPNQYETD